MFGSVLKVPLEPENEETVSGTERLERSIDLALLQLPWYSIVIFQ